MRVIIVDDESLALSYLEHQLKQIPGIELIGKYAEPEQGKTGILEEKPDLVFLDIHLPGISGIELAEQLLEGLPGLNIVFVTAHDDYAVQAFELNALDYVLKPVSVARLRKTVQRLENREWRTRSSSSPVSKRIQLKLLQQVLIGADSQDFTPMRWRTTKAQELFLYLLQHRGQLVRKSLLIELLWPEFEPERAYSHLYTAVYHIRKNLEQYDKHFNISNTADGYMLTLEQVRLDVEEWELFIQSAPPVSTESIDIYESMMTHYAGDYLQEYEYWWAESERHRLKLLWLRISQQMAQWYASNALVDKAVAKYMEICRLNPHLEEAHFALMQIYAGLEHRLSVHQQYRKLQNILSEELNERPGAHVTEWYEDWRRKHQE